MSLRFRYILACLAASTDFGISCPSSLTFLYLSHRPMGRAELPKSLIARVLFCGLSGFTSRMRLLADRLYISNLLTCGDWHSRVALVSP